MKKHILLLLLILSGCGEKDQKQITLLSADSTHPGMITPSTYEPEKDTSFQDLLKQMDKTFELASKVNNFNTLAAIEAGKYSESGNEKFKRNALRLCDSARFYNNQIGSK